jgi:hypothetical protein
MVGFSEVNRSSNIDQTQFKGAPKTVNTDSTSIIDKPDEPVINTKDENKAREHSQGSSPGIFEGLFDDNKEKVESVNPLITLFTLMMALGGAFSDRGKAYNDELMDNAQKSLSVTANFMAKHGNALELDVFGNVKLPHSKKDAIDKHLESKYDDQPKTV